MPNEMQQIQQFPTCWQGNTHASVTNSTTNFLSLMVCLNHLIEIRRKDIEVPPIKSLLVERGLSRISKDFSIFSATNGYCTLQVLLFKISALRR